MTPKIYIVCHNLPGPRHSGLPDLISYALADDGEVVATHVSSSHNFARYDMGLTSERKHGAYREHYPDGYELVDLLTDSAFAQHPGYAAALVRNNQSAPTT